jgi:uroporphyrinogen-III synthase
MAKIKKIKSILITQPPPPDDDNNPYARLKEKFGVKIDFRQFIEVQGVSINDFRKQNVHPLDFTAVIFTSKNAIDHYFRLLGDMKIEMPPEMKYFCVSEATAKYLQKYIVIRKRKLYTGERTVTDLIPLLKKNSSEKFIFPCSSIHTPQLTDFMEANGYHLKKAVIYNTVSSDLSDLADVKYDVLAFFSPSAIESLFHNFPNFVQNDTVVAVFGPTTAQAAIEGKLRVDVEAPRPNLPSMAAAIEAHIKANN